MKNLTVNKASNLVVDALLEQGEQFVAYQMIKGTVKSVITETLDSVIMYSGAKVAKFMISRKSSIVSYVENDLRMNMPL